MSSITIDPNVRPRLQPNAFCRNNQLVSADFAGKIGETLNQVARYRTKELFRVGGDILTINKDWQWRFASHVGPMANVIVVRALVALSAPDSVAYSPNITITIADTSGNTLGTGSAYGGYAYDMGTPSDVPDEFTTVTAYVDASTFRDTTIRATISSIQQARIISLVVYEYSRPADTDNGYVRQQYGIGDPILDTDRSSVQTLATSLYKRGAAPLFNYSADRDVDAPSSSSASTLNLLDSTSTIVTSDSPGFWIDLRNCNRKTATTVPVRFEAYIATGAGASLTLRMRDALTQTDVASITANSATATWYQSNISLPATLAKYDLMFTGNGVNAITVYAVSCYQYA